MLKYPRKKIKFLFPPDKKFYKLTKRIFGFSIRNVFLYQLALVHKSASLDRFKDSSINNERLEYLGDAILDAVIANYLFEKYPNKDEGFLTQMRSKIVNREIINLIAIKLGIPNIIVSKVSSDNHKSIFGDALEALIGALYLDMGFNKTKRFIIDQIIKNHINLNKLQDEQIDFKSKVIEWAQKNRKDINFSNFEESDEKNKNTTWFISHILISNEVKGRGKGNSKKEAEQNAARQALENLSVN